MIRDVLQNEIVIQVLKKFQAFYEAKQLHYRDHLTPLEICILRHH
jgi:hypothetical protein